MTRRTQKNRLLGCWKSDADLTAADIEARRDIPSKSRRGLNSLFGKLTITYRPKSAVSEFEGHTTLMRYKILGQNSECMVLQYLDPIWGLQLREIRFVDDDHYWICLGRFREFFTRVPPAKPGAPRKRSR